MFKVVLIYLCLSLSLIGIEAKVSTTLSSPKEPEPYKFDRACNGEDGCSFAVGLTFHCDDNENLEIQRCICSQSFGECEDGDEPYQWRPVRSHHDKWNCSVGRFGPCGNRNEISVDCHDEGISCVDGRCIDAPTPKAALTGDCDIHKDCLDGLRCSLEELKCIQPKSLNEACAMFHGECSDGLVCTKIGLRSEVGERPSTCQPPRIPSLDVEANLWYSMDQQED